MSLSNRSLGGTANNFLARAMCSLQAKTELQHDPFDLALGRSIFAAKVDFLVFLRARAGTHLLEIDAKRVVCGAVPRCFLRRFVWASFLESDSMAGAPASTSASCGGGSAVQLERDSGKSTMTVVGIEKLSASGFEGRTSKARSGREWGNRFAQS